MVMKITPEHLELIKGAITKYDTPARREMYLKGAFPNADKVKDLDKRYRWDLLYRANKDEQRLLRLASESGYLDSHLDTALRNLVPPLRPARDARGRYQKADPS